MQKDKVVKLKRKEQKAEAPVQLGQSPSRGPKAEWDDPTTDLMGMD